MSLAADGLARPLSLMPPLSRGHTPTNTPRSPAQIPAGHHLSLAMAATGRQSGTS
eukprot:CAMPEP_0202840350 /NCGR_PEP_ID=MMETSP1389-20130828/55459_1 /ASSEMBLY_ACC=CAM_ASM_000865 /TAXON_ID=302021 /ORGANISM="Rhodomonas sp., Strain CCMP768" /LENGTH=54 /DNA_ID=CAMNT_0049516961 /DNA_START=103 /DNA_END=264 /DNA_ORIENTATION=-